MEIISSHTSLNPRPQPKPIKPGLPIPVVFPPSKSPTNTPVQSPPPGGPKSSDKPSVIN